MAHVVVKPVSFTQDGTAYDYEVTIDGTTVYPMSDGFSITFPDNDSHVPVVTMQFWADRLDADLPDAAITAMVVEPPKTDG